MSSFAEREVVTEPATAATTGPAPATGTGGVVALQHLQRTAGNRATVAWVTRRLQRTPAVVELRTDEDVVAYAKSLLPFAGRTVLRDQTRRLFSYVVKHHAAELWKTLGDKWTFDDYPFQDFTFAPMTERSGRQLVGVGPEFVRRIARGEFGAVAGELAAVVPGLRNPELSGDQPGVPGLGPVKAQIEGRIRDRDYQGALDLLVQTKIKDGTIDPSLLAGGAMTYDPDLTSVLGVSDMPFWEASEGRARRTTARIGPGAFSSVAWLYSVVMHEYRHVLQRQSRTNQERDSKLREQGHKSTNEVEAYAWELAHAEETGVKGLPDKAASIWASLVEEYGLLEASDRAKSRRTAEQARKQTRAIVGKDVKLDELPR